MKLKPREIRFPIDIFSPDTMPMARLAEYMQGFAALLGYRDSVHFSRVEPGSTVLVARVEPQDEPKVRERVRRASKHVAPKDAADAYRKIDAMLRDDNAVGEVIEPDGEKLIEFPGRVKKQFDIVGPVSEQGTLDGIPIVVGGQRELVPVHLEDGDGTIHHCEAKRDIAKRLAKHLFEQPVRVQGLGRRLRDKSGKWELLSFRIHDSSLLQARSLDESIGQLKEAHKKSEWSKTEDPLAELDAIRNG